MKDTWAHHGLSESTHEYPEKTQPEAQAASTPANLATHVTPARNETKFPHVVGAKPVSGEVS